MAFRHYAARLGRVGAVLLALLAAGGPATATPAGGGQVGAEKFAYESGQILGAASMCPGIDRARVSAATFRIALLVERSVPGEDRQEAVRAKFQAGIAFGKSAVDSGRTGCPAAVDGLSALETMLHR